MFGGHRIVLGWHRYMSAKNNGMILQEVYSQLRHQVAMAVLGDMSQFRVASVHAVFPVFSVIEFIGGMGPQWAFRHRDTLELIVGFGQVLEVSGPCSRHAQALSEVTDILDGAHPSVRFFGAHQFGYGDGSDRHYWYAIPQVMMVESVGQCQVFYFFNPTDQEVVLTQFDRFWKQQFSQLESVFQSDLDRFDGVQFVPDYSEWRNLVVIAQDVIASGQVNKLVLARQAVIQGEVSGLATFRQFLARGYRGFLFWIQFPFAFACREFFGASPELLFSREHRFIVSEAIAGTSSVEDSGLLARAKDRYEHQWVLDMVRSRLGVLCDDVSDFCELSVIQGNGVQHLYCQISGVLRDGVGDGDVLLNLHPTPAVCGFPQKAALDFLHAHEPFQRGFYSGSIGLFGRDLTCAVVAIRCGCVAEGRTFFYTGAGIVAESNSDLEWQELDLKLSSLLAVVTAR